MVATANIYNKRDVGRCGARRGYMVQGDGMITRCNNTRESRWIDITSTLGRAELKRLGDFFFCDGASAQPLLLHVRRRASQSSTRDVHGVRNACQLFRGLDGAALPLISHYFRLHCCDWAAPRPRHAPRSR